MLTKIISGCQNGADIAGLKIAKRFGLETGGCIPRGFITLDGPKPEYESLYSIKEHSSSKYPPRTYENVKQSDGTVRFAFDFNSPGEKCTFKAITYYKKPFFDVNLRLPADPSEMVNWLTDNKISVLNVAGNSEKTYYGTEDAVKLYLNKVLIILGFQELNESGN